MQRVSTKPDNFLYTNVFPFKDIVRVVGYDTDTGQKVFYDVESLDNLTLFVPQNRASEFVSLKDGIPLKPVSFSSISEHDAFLRSLDKSDVSVFGEFPVHYRYLVETYGIDNVEFDRSHIKHAFIDIETEIGDRFEEADSAQRPVTALSLVVPKSKKAYIYCLKTVDEQTRSWVLGEAAKEMPDYTVEIRDYGSLSSEEQMLEAFCELICEEESVDILSGWNSDAYDMTYLYTRLENLFGEGGAKMLSPFRHTRLTKKFNAKTGRKDFRFYAAGYEHIDYMKAAKKYYGKPLESWSLDFVCQTFLKKTKLHYEGSLKQLYEKDFGKFLLYNLIDSYRVAQLEDVFKYLQLMEHIAYDARMNFSDPFSPVRNWENLIYMECARIGKVIDPRKKNIRMRIPGAYVHNPVPGFRRYTADFDYDSMYPHIHMGWFVSPENMIKDAELFEFFADDEKALSTVRAIIDLREKLPNIGAEDDWSPDEDEDDPDDHVAQMIAREWDEFIGRFERREWDLSFLQGTNICLAPSGEFFFKDETAVMPALQKKKYAHRKMKKDEMTQLKKEHEKTKDPKTKLASEIAHIVQNAEKVTLNSGYGACASPYFRYFDARIARTITTTGRYMIRTCANLVNDRLNLWMENPEKKTYWIYSDTDSSYFDFEDVVKKLVSLFPGENEIDLLDEFIKDVVLVWIDEHAASSAQYFNAAKTMRMKREVIADVSVWRSAKKHYIMRVVDEEGVRKSEPETLMKGTTFIKTSMPKMCRKEFKDVFAVKLMELFWQRGNGVYSKESAKEIKGWLDDFKRRFKEADPVNIASPVTVNNIEKYSDAETMTTTKGAGINVKATVAFNRYVQENNLVQMGFDPIQSGTKMRFVELVNDNPYGSNSFGFVDRLPAGFDKRFIDHDQMFMKNFGNSVQDLLSDLGISVAVNCQDTDVDDIFC